MNCKCCIIDTSEKDFCGATIQQFTFLNPEVLGGIYSFFYTLQ